MINKIKDFTKKYLDKLKYNQTNKWIEENRIDVLGKCFKYDTEKEEIFIRLVSIDTEKKMFTALVVHIPKEINNCETEVLVTNEYGPYAAGAKLPYKDLVIHFVDNLEVFKVDDNLPNEISKSEFTEKLKYAMDKFLGIGY